jgi:hypothetical protein
VKLSHRGARNSRTVPTLRVHWLALSVCGRLKSPNQICSTPRPCVDELSSNIDWGWPVDRATSGPWFCYTRYWTLRSRVHPFNPRYNYSTSTCSLELSLSRGPLLLEAYKTQTPVFVTSIQTAMPPTAEENLTKNCHSVPSHAPHSSFPLFRSPCTSISPSSFSKSNPFILRLACAVLWSVGRADKIEPKT